MEQSRERHAHAADSSPTPSAGRLPPGETHPCPTPGRCITTPATRNAHTDDRRSYVIPTSSGPVRRPSAASDCAAPSIAPCSVGSANTEISPVAAGETTLFPNASTIVQAYSATAVSRYGTTATAAAMANVPAITSARSPTRRDSLAKRYPCTTAAVIPTTVKNQPSSFSRQPNRAAAYSGSATV